MVENPYESPQAVESRRKQPGPTLRDVPQIVLVALVLLVLLAPIIIAVVLAVRGATAFRVGS